MIGWMIFLVLGGFVPDAQVSAEQRATADSERCLDNSPQRNDAVVVTACSALLERRGLLGSQVNMIKALRARAYARQRDYRHAASDYRDAFRAGVWEPSVANGLCWSLAVIGESLDEARVACDARLREVPDDPETLDSRGLVSLKQGRFQDAWDDYNRAFRINPQGVSWLYGRGVAALRLGRSEEGRRDIELAEMGYPGIGAMYASYGIRP